MTPTEREDWLKERRSGIGGSDVAAILGLSPWRSAVQVWMDKTGRAQPQPETEAMRIGTELEDFVARRYSSETGRQVQRYNKMIHKGCLLGNFDRLVVPAGEKVASHMGEIRTDTLLECKTASHEWTDGVPVYYLTQVQHYMGLDPKLEHADVACLFLGSKKHFEIFAVARDQEVIAAMQEQLAQWWKKYVEGDEMPPPASEADCRLLWARSNPGKTAFASPEAIAALKEYAQAKADERAAKERATEALKPIYESLADAEILTDASGKPLCSWKSPKPTQKVDWERLARDLWMSNHPNSTGLEHLLPSYTTETENARRFLLKNKSL